MTPGRWCVLVSFHIPSTGEGLAERLALFAFQALCYRRSVKPFELSLAVVGIDHPNADKTNRRMELILTKPGDPVELRLEPKNKHDPHAIAVISPRGLQVGYLTAERAPYIGARIRDGQEFEAVFQGLDTTAGYIRVRFGGGSPTLPDARTDQFAEGDIPFPLDDSGFYPDEDGPEWGA